MNAFIYIGMKTTGRYSILAGWALLLLVAGACKKKAQTTPLLEYITVEGEAQGTYYRITYADSLGRNFKQEFEAFFTAVNNEVSTYVDNSLISRFNKNEGLEFTLPASARIFLDNLEKSREVYRESGGAFDPTVMPLVSFWGFGPKPRQVEAIDSAKVDSIRQMVGLDRLVSAPKDRDSVLLRKAHPGMQLDFNAIAQGYTVDAVGRMLESWGVQHYLADIGGEVLARGRNPRGQVWTIGINAPREDGKTDEILAAVPLDNRALATSGNYRKFYEVQGVKFSHTINPRTGFPERNALLSASVFASDAMTADAYATACMVLGPEKALEMIERLPDLEAYLVIGMPDGGMEVRYSSGLKSLFQKQ